MKVLPDIDTCPKPVKVHALFEEEEIAGEVGVSQPTIHEKFKELSEMENFPKSIKVHALFEEEDAR